MTWNYLEQQDGMLKEQIKSEAADPKEGEERAEPFSKALHSSK